MENTVEAKEFLASAVAENRRLLGLEPRHGDASTQFKKQKDHDRVAFEAYVAISSNSGSHMMVGAPTLNALAEAWAQVTGIPLDRRMAQRVFIVSAMSKPPEGRDPNDSRSRDAS